MPNMAAPSSVFALIRLRNQESGVAACSARSTIGEDIGMARRTYVPSYARESPMRLLDRRKKRGKGEDAMRFSELLMSGVGRL